MNKKYSTLNIVMAFYAGIKAKTWYDEHRDTLVEDLIYEGKTLAAHYLGGKISEFIFGNHLETRKIYTSCYKPNKSFTNMDELKVYTVIEKSEAASVLQDARETAKAYGKINKADLLALYDRGGRDCEQSDFYRGWTYSEINDATLEACSDGWYISIAPSHTF